MLTRKKRFLLNSSLTGKVANLCGIQKGPFVTVSQCSGTRSRGDELYDRFGGLCENMEGAAAAHICAIYAIPFLEIRGISNLVEDRDTSKWRIQDAAQAACDCVSEIAINLDELMEGI